jgi:hypothetical protein
MEESNDEINELSRVENTEENTEENTKDNTEESTGGSTKESTKENTEDNTEESTDGSTEESTEEDTEEDTEESTEENTEMSTEESTEDNTEDNTEESTKESTKESTEENTHHYTNKSVENPIKIIENWDTLSLAFTGIRDVDRLIFQLLDDKTLFTVLTVNRYCYVLTDDTFWLQRIISRFSINLTRYPREDSHRKVYHRLSMMSPINLLRESARKDYIELIKKLVIKQKGMSVDVDMTGYKISQNVSNKLLIIAASHGSINILKHLVAIGAKVNIDTDKPLRLAAQENHLNIVKYLIENSNIDINSNGVEVLQWAAINGNVRMAKYLVSKGVKIHAENDNAIQYAAEYGNLALVKYFRIIGLDIWADHGEPLRFAKKYKHNDVVKYIEQFEWKPKKSDGRRNDEQFEWKPNNKGIGRNDELTSCRQQ